MTRIILGIDPGLVNTGWGIITSSGSRLSYIASGTVVTKASDPMANRLQKIYQELIRAIAEYRPLECAIEETFVNKNPMLSLKLGHARGVAMLAAGINGIPVGEYAPRLVKKALVGSGAAEKAQLAFIIKHLLPLAKINTEHESDAIAVAICHANSKGVRSLI